MIIKACIQDTKIIIRERSKFVMTCPDRLNRIWSTNEQINLTNFRVRSNLIKHKIEGQSEQVSEEKEEEPSKIKYRRRKRRFTS